MTSAVFRERIRASIADESLQAALDGNARRRVNGRIAAFESLPDWRARRQQAHAVRADVIEHLGAYADQFLRNVAGNGIVVHRASDSAEAVRMVLEIVRASAMQRSLQADHQVLIAKSKSMISEEIELNRSLETNGIRVVETDLGEYIIQLRHERPAHIITPSVHLRRHQVGALFQEKLGIPYTEDIPTLTATARKVLREVFLTADVGISGVNFGVAESGTLCIVTNEGNGRMVTTVPPVHIALMGMERIVPRLQDLALMLSLLPRSATGQKLSVYTQLINGPRRTDEVDGARERHLVLVDNGRTRLQKSPLREILYCIRCGACLNSCPVFREIGGHAYVGTDGAIAPYPGPIGSIVSPALLGMQEFGQLAQASSLCGACKDACPVDIDLPKLLTRVRAGSKQDKPDSQGVAISPLSRIGLRLYGTIGSSPALFTFSQALGGIGMRLLSPFSQWMRIPAFTGWGYSKDFPRVAARSFRRQFKQQSATPSSQGITAEPASPAAPQPVAVQDIEDKVERFSRELDALGGTLYRVYGAELNDRLVRFLKDHGLDSLVAWDQVAGVDEAQLVQARIFISHLPDPAIKAGMTGVSAAIADTGTLLITSGSGQPLTASLLPEIHIAVVRSSQILSTLEQAFQQVPIPHASAAVLITGPSRTADIEMTLTIGVHGPRELAVFVVD